MLRPGTSAVRLSRVRISCEAESQNKSDDTWPIVSCDPPPPPIPPTHSYLIYAPTVPSDGGVLFAGSYTRYHLAGTNWTLYRWQKEWVIGTPGVVALYISTCRPTYPPGTASSWYSVGGTFVGPKLLGVNIGHCAPPAPPAPPSPPVPHPRCSTPECDAIWGPKGCPDLYSVRPDLVRPPMENTTLAAAGRRVRAVAPGFERTQAYHPLYLPTEWEPPAHATRRQYPVIVEYMGNGPWSDGYGDRSTGRPEDSNLGWGMAEPAG
jgi:hypothetical protein